ARRLEVERNVPATGITITFPMGDRHSRDYYLLDLVSDLLAGGESARLYDTLVRRRRLFGAVNAYITGDVDAGMFVMTGQVAPGVEVAEAEAALWDELHRLQTEPVGDYELEKVRNKFEAGVLFGELNVMNKAMNLGYYSMLGTPELINGEVAIYRSISADEIAEGCRRIFTPERSSTLIYRAANETK
ncbi:MAG: insulinase family protein, partial [Rikenellaceae bacterium]|nr:insulinase family protein [Rikenellaceae bacterium]